MADVKVVAPRNIGKGIIWNENTKQYEVNIGEGLEINNEGKVVVKNKPQVEVIDNGTGVIIHQQAIVDTGATVEISGTVILPLPEDPESLVGLGGDNTKVLAYQTEKRKTYGDALVVFGGCGKANGAALGIATNHDIYYHEVGMLIDLTQFNISKVIACSATAGDITGWRKETAWIVNQIQESSTYVPVGVHVYFSKGQTQVPVSYTIKGIKA